LFGLRRLKRDIDEFNKLQSVYCMIVHYGPSIAGNVLN
jgi:hypothetical protein